MDERREVAHAEAGEGRFKMIWLSMGIATGLVLVGADIYFSAVPLLDSVGGVVAWALSLFSSPVEMLAMTLVLQDRYKSMLGVKGQIFWWTIAVIVYIYDITTNFAGFQMQGGGMSTAAADIIRIVISILMAFTEELISKMVAVVAGKNNLIAQLAGMAGKAMPHGGGGGGGKPAQPARGGGGGGGSGGGGGKGPGGPPPGAGADRQREIERQMAAAWREGES